MEKRRPSEAKSFGHDFQEVSSIEWEFVDMSEEEEDLIHRMYRLVGDRWALIAGRIPGRTPEAIERFWIMNYEPCFAERRLKRSKRA
ncbi:transcription factor CPC-like [Curcuma longa]|uniref:transcription factor CPC-like n=1 Tax=Curcuma longa TaxID=136217 RepID=UPI003D9E5B18